MAKKINKREPVDNPTKQSELATWHQRGVFWLAVGLVGLALGIGLGALLLYEWPALFASLGAIGAVLAFILTVADLRWWAMRVSHTIGNSVLLQISLAALLSLVLLLWLFPGRAKISSLTCGDLGCKAPGVVLRFAFDEWTSQGGVTAFDANLSVVIMRETIFQKLSCVNGFQSVEPYSETILDELDLLIDGALLIQSDLELSVQLLNPKARTRLQGVVERQPFPEDQTQLEVTLLALQNNLFEKIVRAIDIQLQPENAALVKRIPTDKPEALRLNNQAVALILHGQLEQAKAQLEKAIALDSRYADAYNNLGQIYRQQGDLQSAVEQYELATELLPCVALYHYNLGFAYEENKAYDAAIAAYKAALVRNPAYVKALNNLGFVYLRTSKLAEAEQYLQQGLVFDPKASYLYKNLGRVYLAQGRTTEAIEQLKEAVTLFADYAEARYFLAEAYRQAGQPQNACDQLAAYAPLATVDALDDPARVQAATVLSTTLTCSTRGATP